MKKMVVLAALMILAVAGGYRALHAQTVGDDLAQALANHGMDAVTAPVAAAAIEIAIANNNALLVRIADDENQIANLTPQTPRGATVIQAEAFAGISGGPSTPTTLSGSGITTGFTLVGETLTYNFTVPIAGNYAVTLQAASSVAGSITINGQTVAIPNTGGFMPANYKPLPGPVLALAAGPNALTVVCQMQHLNLDYFTLAKQ